MEQHPINQLMSVTMERIRELVDVNTVVGQPITVMEGTTVVPISKVNFGFASGGSDFGKDSGAALKFGGGSGAGVNITPIAFMVFTADGVRMMPVPMPVSNTMDRVVEMVPDVLNRIEQFLDKRGEKTAAEGESV